MWYVGMSYINHVVFNVDKYKCGLINKHVLIVQGLVSHLHATRYINIYKEINRYKHMLMMEHSCIGRIFIPMLKSSFGATMR